MIKDNNIFSSMDTKKIKGFAIVLMLMHHLWAFPERIAGGELNHVINTIDGSLISILGLFGKICVSIFFFVGGYGIYMQSKNKDYSILKSIKKLYTSYWKVFIIFIPIAVVFFSSQTSYCDSYSIYARFSNWDLNEILKNFFGFSNSLNKEWWFLYSYLIAIISFPFVKKIVEKYSFLTNIFLIILTSILMTNVFPVLGSYEFLGTLNNNYLYKTIFCQAAPYISCFYLGILFAKGNYIIKLRNLIKRNFKMNFITDLITIISIIYIRQNIVGSELDILYVPILIIVFIDLLNYFPKIGKIFSKLGMHSTNMWLIHTFYCYYFYPVVKIVVGFKWAVPCLIVLIVLSYLSSCIINSIYKLIREFVMRRKVED